MKELFSLPGHMMVFFCEDRDVYLCQSFETRERLYFDSNGQPLAEIGPPADDGKLSYEDHEERAEELQFDGCTCLAPLMEGFFAYSTHEVRYEVDGPFGPFGIMDWDGNRLTEEIFLCVDRFCNGLCGVCNEAYDWGLVDKTGRLVIDYQFGGAPRFNAYGVAFADRCLIDRSGTPIPDTALDLEDTGDEDSRYYTFALCTKEQNEALDRCGRAEGILVDIYDTKTRQYVTKGIPEGKLGVLFFKGEPEVILAAAAMLPDYDEVKCEGKGSIFAKKGDTTTVFDFYQNGTE